VSFKAKDAGLLPGQYALCFALAPTAFKHLVMEATGAPLKFRFGVEHLAADGPAALIDGVDHLAGATWNAEITCGVDGH
jgi:hypothetical protein